MHFLSQIPTAILNNIGFMALLYLIYISYRHFTVHNASRLFTIATLFQLLGLLHFAGTLFLISNNTPTVLSQIAPIHFKIVEINSLLPYIGLVYFLLLLIFSLGTIKQFQQLNKYRQTANYASSDSWNEKLKTTYNTNKHYTIGFSTIVNSPITFGWLDPVIILPIAICNEMSINEIKLILLHEIAHINRNDYFIHLLIEASHKLLYFNPFSYLFVKEISLQREMSCDAWVVAQAANPLFYSKTLYNLAANNHTVTNANLYLGALNAAHELVDRIKHINSMGEKHTKRYSVGIIISALSGLLLFAPALIETSISAKKQVSTLIVSKTIVVSKNSTIPESKLIQYKTIAVKKPVVKIEQVPIVKQLQTNNDLVINDQMLAIDSLEFNNGSTTYTKLVDQTVNWIKARESIAQLAAFEENKSSSEYSIAEKLLMRAILRNYQLKKALLQDKLIQLENEKEANELLNNSIEWKQMLQYEQWTKEFLKLHPVNFAPIDSLRSF
jgi:beta-lactamase regulating signal transducer with metallopeptidase domain